MTHRIGSKGQVVIPKELREQHGLQAGTKVSFEAREDGVLVRAADQERPLRGRFAKSGMARRLLSDRAAERR